MVVSKDSSLYQTIACCSALGVYTVARIWSSIWSRKRKPATGFSGEGPKRYSSQKREIYNYPKNSWLLNSVTLIVLNEVFKEGFLLRHWKVCIPVSAANCNNWSYFAPIWSILWQSSEMVNWPRLARYIFAQVSRGYDSSEVRMIDLANRPSWIRLTQAFPQSCRVYF